MIKCNDTQPTKQQQFITRPLSSGDLALYPGAIPWKKGNWPETNKVYICEEMLGREITARIQCREKRKPCHREWARWAEVG